MAKKNDLKNSMSAGLTGGLDSLIQSTAGQKEAQKPKKAKTVHCNFVMDETYHQNLKLIAIRKGDSLKSKNENPSPIPESLYKVIYTATKPLLVFQTAFHSTAPLLPGKLLLLFEFS